MEDSFVLENLQTLSRVTNFKFSEEVIKRMPNLKKLKITYYLIATGVDEGLPVDFCLNNLDCMRKLESLDLGFSISDQCDVEKIRRSLVSFPHSLKKLTLYGTRLNWKELIIRLGSLPNLQLLRLQSQACVGSRWETTEEIGEQLCNLRAFQISSCRDLKYWEADNAHFPRLEILRLHDLPKLKEIPSSIGDIWTLMLIWLEGCSTSSEDSATRIKDEQEENGNEDLRVVIDSVSVKEEDQIGSDEEGWMVV